MHTITFIRAGNELASIATPNYATAVAIYTALRCVGYAARLWDASKKHAPRLLA